MKVSSFVAATAATFVAGVASTPLVSRQTTDVNPFAGKTLYAFSFTPDVHLILTCIAAM